jgi:hypothetical protein
MKLSQIKVKDMFDYNHDTGDLIRIRRPPGRAASIGSVSGNLAPSGYLRTGIENKSYLNHRLIWLWNYGYLPENGLDHINRNKTDNRLVNLREVSQQCNTRNAKLRSNNSSGIKGVYLNKSTSKWVAKICVGGKSFILGYHTTFIEAVAHRLAAEQCYGWPGCDSCSPAFAYIRKIVMKGEK